MAVSKAKSVSRWILVVLLAALYVLAGAGKFGGATVEMFEAWGYARWFATLIGVLEIAGGIGLLIPRTTRPAVVGLTLIMLGAAYTHVANGESLQVLRPAVFLALLWVVWWLRGSYPSKDSTPRPASSS